ncbi:hypothetical protein NQZ68_036565, partial [Dissostichus eleginoides]
MVAYVCVCAHACQLQLSDCWVDKAWGGKGGRVQAHSSDEAKTCRAQDKLRSIFGEEGPPSLEYIKAKDLFPQKELVKEDESLQVPFAVLQGEGVEYLGCADEAIIAISNYRLHIKFKDSVIN